MLSKNALWIAISSTLAASCLFANVMCREVLHRPSTVGIETAVDGLVSQAGSTISTQELAAESFVGGVTDQISRQADAVGDNCDTIRECAGAAKLQVVVKQDVSRSDGFN